MAFQLSSAISRVIIKGGRPTILFNCDTPRNRRWSVEPLTNKYGHVEKYPDGSGQGVKLKLP